MLWRLTECTWVCKLVKHHSTNRQFLYSLRFRPFTRRFSDDVVVCSLNPTNDYKTVGWLFLAFGLSFEECMTVSSVRVIAIPHSGNMQPVWSSMDIRVCHPADIVSSALSFWQYQIHQESSYQQSVLKYTNEKNAQLQKQLDNVIREGKRASSAPIVISPHAWHKIANGELNLLNNKIQGISYGDRKLDTF